MRFTGTENPLEFQWIPMHSTGAENPMEFLGIPPPTVPREERPRAFQLGSHMAAAM